MPPPDVNVTAVNRSLGSPLLLQCDVSIAKGITSSVEIVWKVNGTEVNRTDGNITGDETYYVYYYNTSTELTVEDNNTVYQCQVIVKTAAMINTTDNVTLNILGEYSYLQ